MSLMVSLKLAILWLRSPLRVRTTPLSILKLIRPLTKSL